MGVIPTKWRRKTADMKQNYVTVTLFTTNASHKKLQRENAATSKKERIRKRQN